jgi:dienelactone hydrolase
VPDVGVLDGDLASVHSNSPLVVFAHGSGSSRHSPRNQAVARRLQREGFNTLLLDLLTPSEERVEQQGGLLRFDVDRLAVRLVAAVDWIDRHHELGGATVGYFGASTGAGGALVAAARQRGRISAVVSRGGRPDLAADHLSAISAPTLLIVGGRDPVVLDLNEKAYAEMTCVKRLEAVAGATHLFEEPHALEQVADLAANWFTRHLAAGQMRCPI